MILVIMLAFLTQVMSFCQNKQNPAQKSPENSQTLTTSQTATIKTILSKYNPSALTAADAKAIHEKLRDAGLHAGPETRDAIVAAGFDPEKLRALDPPKNPGDQGKPVHPSNEERMKAIQEKVIKPLALNPTLNEAVTKAWLDFNVATESLKKTQADQQLPLEKAKMAPFEKARDDKIRKALTQEQFAKYQELEKASRPPKPNGPEPKKD